MEFLSSALFLVMSKEKIGHASDLEQMFSGAVYLEAQEILPKKFLCLMGYLMIIEAFKHLYVL